MNFKEFAAAFLIGAGIVFIVELLLRFQNLWTQIPDIPFVGRTKLVGGSVAVMLIWLLKEKKLGFIPISI